jgi:hypothetical protein
VVYLLRDFFGDYCAYEFADARGGSRRVDARAKAQLLICHSARHERPRRNLRRYVPCRNDKFS